VRARLNNHKELDFINSKERKERKKMSILEKELPKYHDTMFLEGYEPHEILRAAHETMIKKYVEENEEDEDFGEVTIKTEVKK
jgi:hypothetical protein